MRRPIAFLVVVLVLALTGFYVAWPAWSGYQIREGLRRPDAALLESKIDFPSVRTSLQPVVMAEAQKLLERGLQDSGFLAGILGPQVRQQVLPRLVDATLESVVTPTNLARMIRQRGNLRELFQRGMAEEAGRIGGRVLGGGRRGGGDGQGKGRGAGEGSGQGTTQGTGQGDGKGQERASVPKTASDDDKEDAAKDGSERRRLGFANVKRLAWTSPTTIELGINRDATASAPELTARLAFTGFDWRLVALLPQQ